MGILPLYMYFGLFEVILKQNKPTEERSFINKENKLMKTREYVSIKRLFKEHAFELLIHLFPVHPFFTPWKLQKGSFFINALLLWKNNIYVWIFGNESQNVHGCLKNH